MEVGAFVRGILCGRVFVPVVRDWAEREIDIGLTWRGGASRQELPGPPRPRLTEGYTLAAVGEPGEEWLYDETQRVSIRRDAVTPTPCGKPAGPARLAWAVKGFGYRTGREARATAAKREKAGENPAVENQQVPIWEPANARRPVFNGYHMGTKVPIQLPFWGGVSPLQPARSAVFSPRLRYRPVTGRFRPHHGDSRAASGGAAAAPRAYAENAAGSPTRRGVGLRPVRSPGFLVTGFLVSITSPRG